MTNERFDRAYEQHVTEFEGEDELSSAFENLLIDNDDDDSDFNDFEPPTSDTEIRFTSFEGVVLTGTSENLITKLCNHSFSYQITEQGLQPPYKDENIVNTFINKPTLRYDSGQFFGVYVDTRVSTYSTGRYRQFKAL
jgi:hypothetical protein